jgi:peptidoglycan/LPS O-acetylase OafA/YrhL
MEKIQHGHQRLFFLDWIRAISTVLIVLTHYNNPYLVSNPIFVNAPFGIYIGSLGVSQFLIISGAALMYSHQDEESLNLKNFFWKRFKSLYPMFWIAFIIANSILFLKNGAHIYAQSPKWSIVFSFLGIDGYLANAGLPTFYTLGEWFLGFIVIFYVFFPFLMYCVKKYPVITAVVSICLYVGTLLYSGTFFALPKDLLITTRLPELLFGMYFMRYIKKVPATVGICAIAFLALQQFTSFLTDDVAVTLVGIAMFLLLVWVADFFDRQPVRVVIASISKYSYAIFLVHHQVISQVFSAVFPTSRSGQYLLFFVDCLIIVSLSVLLVRLNTVMMNYCKKMFARKPVAQAIA